MRLQSYTPRTPATPLLLLALVLPLCLSAPQIPAQTATQTAVQATTLPLILPTFLAYDTAGNLFFAETNHHVIRKIDPSGAITTVAGTGQQGFAGDGGPASAALIDSPTGIAVDPAGNLFFADTHNHRVRRVDANTHTISTIAGTGHPAFSGDSGPATAASLSLPTALALDAGGNLYLADSNNHRIRRIDAASANITTVAGNGTQGYSGDAGPAVTAAIDTPTGLALDASGNLFLADTRNHRIRRVDAATQRISTIAGTGAAGLSGDLGPATAASLNLPHGLTLDPAGNLYLADTRNHRIRRIDAVTGVITTIAGADTQAFAGDTHPAVSASLDSPRATTLSPTGLVTLADTANGRIRQIDSAAIINTLAGLGVGTPGTFTLSAPAVIAYGTGTLTAAMSAPTYATGAVTFFDTTLTSTAPSTTTIGTASLSANAASLPATHLSAGAHHLTATYAGDASHPSAQTPTLLLNVSAAQLTASPTPASALYGQPIPTLTGTITGLLPQDADSVTAGFTTSAPATLPPANVYPIAVTLSGPSAGNYNVTTNPAVLTIAKAPTVTTLSASAIGPTLTVTAQTASTTAGVPTGSIAILDGGSSLGVLPLSSSSAISYTNSNLPLGAHSIAALYSGDTNFVASTSAPALEVIGTSADFTLTATGQATQRIPGGTPASFGFAIQVLGNSLASPINLAAAGLPLGATASFNPAYIPPGGAVSAFILTIQTPAHALLHSPSSPHRPFPPITLALLLMPVVFLRRRRIALLACVALIASTGCGNRINTAGDSTASKTYTITVGGTATGPTGLPLQHNATVTLVVF